MRRRKKIERLEKRSEKAHERLDAARDKLPTKKVLKKERVLDEDKGKAKTRLFFEDEVKKPKTQSKLTFEADKSVRKVGDTLASGIHGKIHEVEGDNSAVEAAHKTEILVESATRQYSHHKKAVPISLLKRFQSWNTRQRWQTKSCTMKRLFRNTLR